MIKKQIFVTINISCIKAAINTLFPQLFIVEEASVRLPSYHFEGSLKTNINVGNQNKYICNVFCVVLYKQLLQLYIDVLLIDILYSFYKILVQNIQSC